MRLQQYKIDSITSIASTIFGKGSKIILFGSRVHDNLNEGDIDLYIQPTIKNALREKK
jgi:predicted nucleotidyltransferase